MPIFRYTFPAATGKPSVPPEKFTVTSVSTCDSIVVVDVVTVVNVGGEYICAVHAVP